MSHVDFRTTPHISSLHWKGSGREKKLATPQGGLKKRESTSGAQGSGPVGKEKTYSSHREKSEKGKTNRVQQLGAAPDQEGGEGG